MQFPILRAIDNTPEERDAVHHCMTCFVSIDSYCTALCRAVELFNFADTHANMWSKSPYNGDGQLRMFLSWKLIAARDGAMSIYHFTKAMEGANYWANKSKSIGPFVQREVTKAAGKNLREAFPRIEAIRHAVAHAGEINKSRDHVKEHSIQRGLDNSFVKSDNTSNVIINNCLSGATFTMTWQGELLEYDINSVSAQALQAVRNLYFSAFSDLDPGWKPE